MRPSLEVVVMGFAMMERTTKVVMRLVAGIVVEAMATTMTIVIVVPILEWQCT